MKSSKQVSTSIFIEAPPAKVWEVVRDLPNYPRWTSLLTLKPWGGELRVGGRAWLRIRVFGLPLLVAVEVESVSVERLAWIGGPRGLVRGRHYFDMRQVEGGTEFVHGEEFHGVLLPALWSVMEPELQRLYAGFNRELARYVEGL